MNITARLDGKQSTMPDATLTIATYTFAKVVLPGRTGPP